MEILYNTQSAIKPAQVYKVANKWRVSTNVRTEEHDDIVNYVYDEIIVDGYPTNVEQIILQYKLSNNEELIKAMERIVATNGVTEDDKALAQERLEARYQLNNI